MRTSIAALTLCLAASLPMAANAQSAIEKSTPEEVLKASLSAVAGDTATIEPEVTEKADASGETIRTFTFTGSPDDANSIFAQCHILMDKESGIDREAGVVRQIVETTPVCGAQYKSMRDVISVSQVQASFSVREYSF